MNAYDSDSSVEYIKNGDEDHSNSDEQKKDVKLSCEKLEEVTSIDCIPLNRFQASYRDFIGLSRSSTRNEQLNVVHDDEKSSNEANSSNKNDSKVEADHLAPDLVGIPTKLIDVCKSIVDKHTQKWKSSECSRSSLEAALFEVIEATQKKSHSLEHQSDSQRLESEQLVSGLQTRSHEMECEIEKLKMKCDLLEHKNIILLAGTTKYAETIEDLYPKHANLLVELKVAKDKYINLQLELAQRQYQSSNIERHKILDGNECVKKLQEENAEMKRLLENSNEKNVELMAEKNSLKDLNHELTLKFEKLTLENQSMTNEIKMLDRKCDVMARETDVKVYEAKLRQWCATCGCPGGPYYCSQRCKFRDYRR